MGKLNIGDYVNITYTRENGVVIGDRGGHVGRWTIELDKGGTSHVSSRDCIVIRPATPRLSCCGDCDCEERLDRLMEYLQLEEVEKPAQVKIWNGHDRYIQPVEDLFWSWLVEEKAVHENKSSFIKNLRTPTKPERDSKLNMEVENNG